MPILTERTITPTEQEQRVAAESSQVLAELTPLPHELRVEVVDRNAPRAALSLPAPAVRMLAEILKELAKGNSVTLVANDAMLSTQEAADLLNVSRPFLVGLLEAGRIPYQRLGSHRRVRFHDLMALKAKTDAAREDAMRQLTKEAQALKLSY